MAKLTKERLEYLHLVCLFTAGQIARRLKVQRISVERALRRFGLEWSERDNEHRERLFRAGFRSFRSYIDQRGTAPLATMAKELVIPYGEFVERHEALVGGLGNV